MSKKNSRKFKMESGPSKRIIKKNTKKDESESDSSKRIIKKRDVSDSSEVSSSEEESQQQIDETNILKKKEKIQECFARNASDEDKKDDSDSGSDSDNEKKISKRIKEVKEELEEEEKAGKKKTKKKEIKIYDNSELDLSIFDDENFQDNYLTNEYAKDIRNFLSKPELKETEIKKTFNVLWKHVIDQMKAGMISDVKDIQSIFDRCYNMVAINNKFLEKNTRLKTKDEGRSKSSHTKVKSLDVYIFTNFTDETRQQIEIINIWNLLFVSLSLLKKIDDDLYDSVVKTFKEDMQFTIVFNRFRRWFEENKSGSQFNPRLGIFKKERVKKIRNKKQ